MGQSSKEIIAFAVIFPVLATVAVGLRFWCRRKMGQKLSWDDYLVFAAVVSCPFATASITITNSL